MSDHECEPREATPTTYLIVIVFVIAMTLFTGGPKGCSFGGNHESGVSSRYQ